MFKQSSSNVVILACVEKMSFMGLIRIIILITGVVKLIVEDIKIFMSSSFYHHKSVFAAHLQDFVECPNICSFISLSCTSLAVFCHLYVLRYLFIILTYTHVTHIIPPDASDGRVSRQYRRSEESRG